MGTLSHLKRIVLIMAGMICFCAVPQAISADGRVSEILPGPWRFIASNTLTWAEAVEFDAENWKLVQLPHCWQTLNDQTDYSHAWYRTEFELPEADRGRRIYLKFEAAGITANVYLNGRHLGRHVGAYTSFTLDASEAVNFGGNNVLAVRCDSKDDIKGNLSRPEDRPCYYWNVAGGLHRPVHLIKAAPTHIDPLYFGSDGVFVTGRKIEKESVRLDIETRLRNSGTNAAALAVEHVIFDPSGAQLMTLKGTAMLASQSCGVVTVPGEIRSPRLWSVSAPLLYRVETRLFYEGNRVDYRETMTGFRSFQKTREGKFELNGERIRLIGAALHTRDEKKFHAVTAESMGKMIQFFPELGFNSIFLSHYSPPSFVLDICDRLGLLAWVENGFVGSASSGLGSYQREVSEAITTEMVFQNWNHPSVFAWSVGNEVQPENLITPLIDTVAGLKDPNRLLAYNTVHVNNHTAFDKRIELFTNSQFPGWYPSHGKSIFDCTARYINQHGAGAHIAMQESYRSASFRIDQWEPEAFQQQIAEAKCHQLYDQGIHELYWWWQFADQECPKLRNLINSKGLLTMAGYPKDVFYLFKAYAQSKKPLVYICGKHWFLRQVNELKVYANGGRVSLKVNGVDKGSLDNGAYELEGRKIRNVFLWSDVFGPGRNDIEVTDGCMVEKATIYYQHGDNAIAGFIRNVKASNGEAHLLDIPVQPQWPFYSQFDGGAINTFDALPQRVANARWISTRRQSEAKWKTGLSFTADVPIQLYVICDKPMGATMDWLTGQGFAATGEEGIWRGNDLKLKPYTLMLRNVEAGAEIRINAPETTCDWVCLISRR